MNITLKQLLQYRINGVEKEKIKKEKGRKHTPSRQPSAKSLPNPIIKSSTKSLPNSRRISSAKSLPNLRRISLI